MRRALALVCAAAVSTTLLVQAPTARSAPDPDGAEALLEADADGPVQIRREGGVVTFVGTPVGTDIDNPAVDRGTTVSAAARAHLRRYGPMIGTDRPGSVLAEAARARSVAGVDVVRYRQEVDGLPVVGGEAVVTLTGDRDLGSLNANLSTVEQVPEATVTEQAARTVALALVGRSTSGTPVAEDQGRWLFDPAAVSWPGTTGARGVWRFEVRVGDGVRRMVFVDDRTGGVVLDVDLIQHIDRVVCDQANVATNVVACTTGFVRSEGSSVSDVPDVEQAFANSGAVSDFFQQVVGVDLTGLIGIHTAGGRKLSSTVRVCVTGSGCPYANAFWNGQAMFYGEGYAAADDVVGHEMTHGVIERTSGLLYWDQSGAINESLADILGEIIDHRNVDAGDSPDDWRLGEDLPGGALRDMADPTVHGQPDRMTSPLWDTDLPFRDAGGVHTNSGVGNKAFHLISQGGTFNGQSITGIDIGDATLTKSALLWIQTLATVTTFTEYADLAVVLGQACSALRVSHGFTAADCTAVSKAIAATEMGIEPPADPVRDADRTCPTGTFKKTLLDSEAGSDPASKFTGAGWGRIPGTPINAARGVHAYSGGTSWVASNPNTTANLSLTAAAAVSIPQDQPVYLAFRHWHLFEFEVVSGTGYYYDGGTVDIDDVDDALAPYRAELRPWVHGPTRTLQPPNGTRKAFAGSSRGWVGSRVDLSAFGGRNVKPIFTVRTDSSIGFIGWYLDDIELYTCASSIDQLGAASITGSTPRVGGVLTANPGRWDPPDAAISYQWLRNGTVISGAGSRTYTAVVGDLGTTLGVRVTATVGTVTNVLEVSSGVTVQRGLLKPPSTVSIAGRRKVGQVLAAAPGAWRPSGVTFRYRWLRDGKPIAGATSKRYLLRRADAGHRIRVRIVGVKTGYNTATRTSTATTRIAR